MRGVARRSQYVDGEAPGSRQEPIRMPVTPAASISAHDRTAWRPPPPFTATASRNLEGGRALSRLDRKADLRAALLCRAVP